MSAAGEDTERGGGAVDFGEEEDDADYVDGGDAEDDGGDADAQEDDGGDAGGTADGGDSDEGDGGDDDAGAGASNDDAGDSDEHDAGDDGGTDDDDGKGGDDDGEDEDEEDGPMIRRKRQRQRISDELDDDDYDLLEENTGHRYRADEDAPTYRRLTKRAREDGDEDAPRVDVDEDEDAEGEDARRAIEQGLFDGDEDEGDEADDLDKPEREAEIGSDDEDEDDFIVDEDGKAVKLDDRPEQQAEEIEEAQEIFGSAEEIRDLLAFTKHRGALDAMEEEERAEALGRGNVEGEEGGELGPDVDEDLDEEDDAEEEDEGEEDEDEEARLERRRQRAAAKAARRRDARVARRAAASSATQDKVRKMYPPAMLAKNFMLEEDEVKRTADVPERMQARAHGRLPPADGELRSEAEWIVTECGEMWLAQLNPLAPPTSAQLGALVDPVARALELMRVDMLEVPAVHAYHCDAVHPLEEGWLWDVWDQDGRWAKLLARRAELRAQWVRDAERLGLASTEEEAAAFEHALARAEDETEVQDVADHLALRQGVALRGAEAARVEGSATAQAAKPQRQGLLAAALRAGVDVLAAQLGLSSAHFATNLRDGWATHVVQEAPDTAEGAAEAFVAAALEEAGGRPPPGLASGQPADALAAMRELAAQQIATEVSVREYVRTHMLDRAMVVVELTDKGEKEIDGLHTHAELRRYQGEALRRLLRDKSGKGAPSGVLPPAERAAALLRILRAQRAQAEGLARVRVAMPEYASLERDELYAEFLRSYCPDNESPLPPADPEGAARNSWNVQRYLLLKRALVELLYDRIAQTLEARLAADAQRVLVHACQRALDESLSAARPLRSRDLRERRPLQRDAFSARSSVVGVAKDPNSTTVVLAKLTPDGELVDWLRCEWLHVSLRRSPSGDYRTRSGADRARKAEELAKVAEFLSPPDAPGPDFVVLGASHLRARDLRTEFENLGRAIAVRAREGDRAFDLYNECSFPLGRVEMVDSLGGMDRVRREPLEDARPPITMTLAEMDEGAPFRCLFAPEVVPAFFAASEAAVKELGERHPLLWRAVSIARMAQDAVVELAHVAGPEGAGLASMHLHPLQTALPREVLLEALTERMVSWVARLGVRLPWVLAHGTQGKNLLQYLPGLGPRKGARLFDQLANLAQAGQDVSNRAELAERNLLGHRVFASVAGFVYFAPVASAGQAEEDLELEPSLEMTRVHPEHYEYANQLCVQAAADEEAEELPEQAEAVRAMIGNREMLQQLELSEYARFLRGEEMDGAAPVPEEERRELELQLESIRQALTHPYTDPRNPICDRTPDPLPPDASLADAPPMPELLSGDRLFEHLTGESRFSLSSGLLTAKALRAGTRGRQPGMWCALDNGMQAFLPAEQMSDQGRDWGSVGADEYPISVGQSFHCVVLRPDDVDAAKCEATISCRGEDLARADFRTVAEQRAHNERPAGPKILKRRITHPLFQNVVYEKACEILKQGAPGDVLFRPSSKGENHLTMSWVWAPGTILHVDVVEHDKASPEVLGRRLVVGYREGSSEGETYEALDEIHARYAAPISDLVAEAMGHRKFLAGKQADVDAVVRREKLEAPRSIPYRVGVCDKPPGHLLLAYAPGSRSVHHELISIKPEGFKLRSKVHPTLERMLQWFKQNYQQPPARPPPPPAAPPISSWPRQEHMGAWEGNPTAAENARANAQAASNFLGGLIG